jgi:hypothetical protein
MRIFYSVLGLLIALLIVALLIQPAAWMWWVLGALVILAIAVPVVGFVLRGNAPDDKFPWE